jgi:hypothetical protein
MYASLRYLSLSDSTVVTFLAPILIGTAGKVSLYEPFALKQTLAGCESFHISTLGFLHPGSGTLGIGHEVSMAGRALVT